MKAIDYSAWRFWINIFQMSVICVIGVYTWWANREKVTNKRFQEHHQRMLALEDKVKYVPSQKQYDVLSQRIEAVHGDLRQISGQLLGINRAVDLMNEFLINQGGKG